jgi:nucleoid-associated protein YgaU
MRYFRVVADNPKPTFNPIGEYVHNQKTYDVYYAALASASGSSVPTTRYTVRDGDTLKSIAKSYYQDESKWTVIYAVNSSLRRPGQNDLPAGLVVKVPVIP